MSDLFGLWPHQMDAVNEIEEAWASGIKSICFQLPTGGGKSRVIRTIVDNHAQSKKTIYIIAHRRTLVKQLSEEILEAGIKHGIIASEYPYISYRVQVCSLQTLTKRIATLPAPEVIIIDEFHHSKSKSYERIIKHWPEAKILGVTATPQRLDGKPLADVCQKLIIGPSMRQLIDENFLCDYDYYAPEEEIDFSDVHIRTGEFVQSEILVKIDKNQITGNAIEHYKRYADHQPGIICCVSISHAEHVARQFREAGYRAIAIHSGLPDNEIEKAISDLRTGEIELLVQCELIGEGVDIPGATVLICLRPTASLTIHLQHCGRVLRRGDGKRAVILDHVGNYKRHGLPDDPREWSLDGVDKNDCGRLDYKRCPECIHPVPLLTKICPHCGYEWRKEERCRALPTEKEGQLVNIRGEITNDLVLMIARGAKTLKDAVKIATELGYKHTTAYVIWTKYLYNNS